MKCKHCGAEWKAASSTGALASCPFCGKAINSKDYFIQGKANYNARNYDEAISCLEKAAEQGHVDAQFEVAQLYMKLKGDSSKAEHWYYQAAVNGNTEAQYLVGSRYDNENSSEFDYSQAEYWYYQAAMKGHIEAQLSLGLLYGLKDWSGQNYSSAEYWLLRNIKEYPHNKESPFYSMRLYFLGCIYRKCNNFTEAVKWLLKATENGGRASQSAIKVLQEMAIEGHIEAIIALDQIKNRGFSISRAWNDIFC